VCVCPGWYSTFSCGGADRSRTGVGELLGFFYAVWRLICVFLEGVLALFLLPIIWSGFLISLRNGPSSADFHLPGYFSFFAILAFRTTFSSLRG
jgi:hypothetical protein